MERNWVILVVAFYLMVAAICIPEQCSPISEEDWRRTRNTVERLDKDMDDLKARKCCECPK